MPEPVPPTPDLDVQCVCAQATAAVNTALHVALNLRVLRTLIRQDKAQLSVANHAGRTPLDEVNRRREFEMAKALLLVCVFTGLGSRV